MPDEAGRFTAEHIVMESGMEIRELKHLLEVKDNKIKELEKEIVQLKSPDYPKSEEGLTLHFDAVDAAIAADDKSEDNFTEQLSFSLDKE